MKRLALLFSLSLLCLFAYSQDYQWIKQYGESGIFVQIDEIAETTNNQIVVGGLFHEITFGGVAYLASKDSRSRYYDNMFVANYGKDGTENWIRVFTSPSDMELISMDVDANGNTYLLFESNDPVTSGNDTFLQDADPSYEGGFQLLKLDPTGNLLWRENQFANSESLQERGNNIQLSDIAVSPSGELHVALAFVFDFRLLGWNEDFKTSNREDDPLLVKYQANGQLAWAIQGKSQWSETVFNDDKTLDVEVDSEGNVLLGGTFIDSGESLGLTFGNLPMLPVTQEDDGVFLAKFSANGTPLWLKGFTDDDQVNINGSENEQLTHMVTDGTDILLAINFNNDLVIGAERLLNQVNNGRFPYNGNAIVKLNANGDLVWVQEISGGDLTNQIGVDPVNKQYAILGNYSTADFIGSSIKLADEENDFFLALYGENGDLISVDTTEYTAENRNSLPDKYPIEYLSDGSLVTSMGFIGRGSVKFNKTILEDVYTVLLKVDLNNRNVGPSVNLGPDIVQCEGEAVLDAGTFTSYLWSTGETTQSITVDVSGIYSVQVIDEDGLSASDEINVFIDQPIQFSFPDTLKGFASVSIVSPVEAARYEWSTEETTSSIKVNSSGLYSLNLFTENGCESSASVYVEIYVLDIYRGGIGNGHAEGNFIEGSNFYAGGNGDGAVYSLIVNANSFYGGGHADGKSTAQFTNTNGFYGGGEADGTTASSFTESVNFYKGGVGSGWSASEVGLVLSLLDNGAISEYIQVYPNPAVHTAYISTEKNRIEKLEVYNLAGTKVLEKDYAFRANESLSFSVESLPSGTYLIRESSESQKLKLLT